MAMFLKRYFLVGWLSVCFGVEGPLQVLRKLLQTIGEILKLIRSL